jgi:negative regulator of sigma E activity
MRNSAISTHEGGQLAEDTTLSALADGELDHQETVRILETMSHRDDWRVRWQSYHVIGDCLRGTPPLKLDLATRISLLLAENLRSWRRDVRLCPVSACLLRPRWLR